MKHQMEKMPVRYQKYLRNDKKPLKGFFNMMVGEWNNAQAWAGAEG